MNEIILNHFYNLHHDEKRTYILGLDEQEKFSPDFVNIQWTSKIHPLFAMILSLLSDPITISDAIEQISYFLDITNTESEKILTKLLNSNTPFYIEYDGVKSLFPKNIIIDVAQVVEPIKNYSLNEFVYTELDLEQERFYRAPLGIVYMINNTCATDCVYCYADKLTKCSIIPFEKTVDIIKEARKLDVQSFSIVGGEFFMYKQWDKLLDILIYYNYKPTLISTKIPINEQIISKYKGYNLRLQISLDSLNGGKLTQILGVESDYVQKIKKTIELLDKYNIKFQISTVLTKYNNDIYGLEVMSSFLSQFTNLTRWEIRVGFKSLYSKSNFNKIKIEKKEILEIEKWIQNKKKTSIIPILWSPNDETKYFTTENGSRNFIGSRCSANYSHMIILPDGQVTICEQLYWNPKFIIGDIRKSSISDVWCSAKALTLAFPQKKDFREKSVCFQCEIFEKCIPFPNRCIADILKGYGAENWDYPDPRCNKAPAFINELT